jgi:hypothetical protein
LTEEKDAWGLPLEIEGPWPAPLRLVGLYRSRGRACYFQLEYGGVKLPSGSLVEMKDGKRFVAGPSRIEQIRGKPVRVTFWRLTDDMAAAVQAVVEGLLGIG